jgi:hypothetical protein
MGAAIECPAGYYSPARSQECFLCALGRQCNEAARGASDYETDAYRAVGWETTLPDV